MNNYTDLISLYTSQLENLDATSVNYILTGIAFLGVIIGIIVKLMSSRQQSIDNKDVEHHNRVLALLCLFIPIIISIIMHVFSLNSRKVAIYRAYLWFLEEKVGLRFDAIDNGVLGKFFASDSRIPLSEGGFLTNRQFLPLFLLLGLAFIVFAVLSFRYIKEMSSSSRTIKVLFFILAIVLLLGVVEDIIKCCIDLMNNDETTSIVYNFLINLETKQ